MNWKAAPRKRTAFDMMTPRQRRIASLKQRIAGNKNGPEVAQLTAELELEERLEAV